MQRFPLDIDAPVGTKVAMRGVSLDGNQPVYFDHGRNEWATDGSIQPDTVFTVGSVNHPEGEPAFIPGGMMFPAPGCYQIFVTVAATEYGPFGMNVVAQKYEGPGS